MTTNTNTAFDVDRLCRILSLNRAHGGAGVEALILNELTQYEASPLIHGANSSELGLVVTTDPNSKTLFVAHMDTAEQWDKQLTREVLLDANTNTVMSDGKHVLGADDGAGIAILLHMIDNKVPGTYLFTHGEEKGGIGAKGISVHHAEMLKGFDRAIAFDRRGTESVITHQARGRCCSDEFAEALANALDSELYAKFPDSTGVYTDTAEFTDAIGECTNISIGYDSEHSSRETLDLTYLMFMADKVLTVDWEALPTKRQPGEVDPDATFNFGYGWGSMRGRGGTKSSKKRTPSPECADDINQMTSAELFNWVKKADSREIVTLLNDLAMECDESYENGYGDGYNEGACIYEEVAAAQGTPIGADLSSDDIPGFEWPFADPQ